MQSVEGQFLQARDKGTPQGGKLSCRRSWPICFCITRSDLWVTRHLPGVRFARYADDAVLHRARADVRRNTCLSASGNGSRPAISQRHPGKTRIVYCKDINRTEENPDIQFTFLGYTFR